MATNERSAARTLLVVAIIAIGAAAFVSASHKFSTERIAENERQRLLARLTTVLDPATAARMPTAVRVEDTDRDLLGSDKPVDIYVMMDAGEPVATIIASIAPDGYNAPIRLLVGISTNGTVTGVRVLSLRETPGLGDRIERSKSDWILQFDGKSLKDPPASLWGVKPDGGAFDALTGATVTPRAVVRAVHNTLRYFDMNHDRLYAQARRALEQSADTDE